MRTLLIDADVFAYQASAANEVATDWGDGYWTWHCDIDSVKASIDAAVAAITEELEADAVALCLTDSDTNFRKRVYPTYKGNRAAVKKPLVLKAIREWLIAERGAYLRPNLEGDDVMGILATHPRLIPGEKIIVSIDKDMKTIPGPFYRNAEDGLVTVSEDEADLFFLTQVLTGDPTDGYPGCPGVGPKKAAAIIQDAIHATDTPNKSALSIVWPAVVRAYEKAGLTEDDAIVQARCARILRFTDYDFKRKEPILWTPSV